mmetsp:Transcript_14590/g.49822  ORF Transcript_14590/g.49822 Transcript_14590/m.49822 type:complete len:369 (-) Transcript_14590:4237-5343(-)
MELEGREVVHGGASHLQQLLSSSHVLRVLPFSPPDCQLQSQDGVAAKRSHDGGGTGCTDHGYEPHLCARRAAGCFLSDPVVRAELVLRTLVVADHALAARGAPAAVAVVDAGGAGVMRAVLRAGDVAATGLRGTTVVVRASLVLQRGRARNAALVAPHAVCDLRAGNASIEGGALDAEGGEEEALGARGGRDVSGVAFPVAAGLRLRGGPVRVERLRVAESALVEVARDAPARELLLDVASSTLPLTASNPDVRRRVRGRRPEGGGLAAAACLRVLDVVDPAAPRRISSGRLNGLELPVAPEGGGEALKVRVRLDALQGADDAADELRVQLDDVDSNGEKLLDSGDLAGGDAAADRGKLDELRGNAND